MTSSILNEACAASSSSVELLPTPCRTGGSARKKCSSKSSANASDSKTPKRRRQRQQTSSPEKDVGPLRHVDQQDGQVSELSTTAKLQSLAKEAEVAPGQAPEIAQQIVRAMSGDLQDAALQIDGALALHLLAKCGTRIATAIVAAGGIDTLVKAAKIHCDIDAFQQPLCQVFHAISIYGPEHR